MEKMKFPKEQMKFLEKHIYEKLEKFPRVTYVLNFFATMTISYSFLYRLATYHWKAFKEGYNFVLENTSIKIHMKKL
jgi:hypothetical protein